MVSFSIFKPVCLYYINDSLTVSNLVEIKQEYLWKYQFLLTRFAITMYFIIQ